MNNLLSLPEAGPIRRVLALGYDTLMATAITLFYILLMSFATIAFSALHVGDAVEVYDQLWYRIGLLSVNILFFVYFWHRAGQTIGMRAWRLKLIDEQGNNPSLKQCIMRCALAPFSIALVGLGYWWCWIDRDGRSAHDRLTGTRVILMPKIKKPSA